MLRETFPLSQLLLTQTRLPLLPAVAAAHSTMSDLCWTCMPTKQHPHNAGSQRAQNRPVEKSEVKLMHSMCNTHTHIHAHVKLIVKIIFFTLSTGTVLASDVSHARDLAPCIYKNEVEQSRKDVHAHFSQEGRGFQNILFPFLAFAGDYLCCV